MGRLIDKIRGLLLKLVLPKQQYYIQNNGFHSVFHPIMFEKKEGIFNGTGYKNDNSQ